MNLSDLAKHKSLNTEEKCIAKLEEFRWPEGVRCPACDGDSVSSFQTKGKSGKIRHLYQCLERNCRYQFSPTTGTIFHDSHLPLRKWYHAIALLCDRENPLSINQLRLALGVQYKTASHVNNRVRLALENDSIELSANGETGTRAASARAGSTQRRIGPARSAWEVTPKKAIMSSSRSASAGRSSYHGSGSGERATTVDNMLSMFITMAQVTARPPSFFVNYLRNKVFT
jgi:hypothetical protein